MQKAFLKLSQWDEMQEERDLFWAAFKWMEMVRNEKGQSCWNCQTTIDTGFEGVSEKGRMISQW